MNDTLESKSASGEGTSAAGMSKNDEIKDNISLNNETQDHDRTDSASLQRDEHAADEAGSCVSDISDGADISNSSDMSNDDHTSNSSNVQGGSNDSDTSNSSDALDTLSASDAQDLSDTQSLSDDISAKDTSKDTSEDVSVTTGTSDIAGAAETKKKKSRFWKGLLIYCIVMVLLVLVASGVWWEYIREYEQTLPNHKAEEVADNFKDYLSNELEEMYISSVTKFEDWDDIFEGLFVPAIGEEFTYTKLVKEYTSETPVYSILSGNNQVAKITLANSSKKTLFGFEKWEVLDVELLADMSGVNTLSFKIKAPTDLSVYVNGVLLENGDVSSTELYNGISKWEKASEDIPYRNVYTISGLYKTPVVEIKDKNGNSVDFENSGDGLYLCDFPEDVRHSVTIIAPYDAKAYLGGVALSEDEISNSFIECEYTSKYDNAHLVEYTVSGLLTDPVVSVEDANGNPLEVKTSDESHYVYGYDEDMKHSMFLAVPSSDGINIKVNGNDIEDGLMVLVGENHIYPELDNIRKYIYGVSKLNIYRIDDLYGSPEITVTDENGNEMTGKKESDEVLYFLPSSDDGLKTEHEALVEAYIDAYIRYTSGGYKVVDITFDAAAEYLVPDSPAYESLLSTKFSFGQNKEFFIKSREITSYDYIKLGSNCFSCMVDFTANIYTTYTSTIQNVTDTVKGMKLWYVNVDGEWKIAGLKF